MATPKMLVQQISAALLPAGNQVIRVNTFNPDGSVLNVSSGYTVHTMNTVPSQDRNLADTSDTDITSYFTPTFDATGISLLCENGGLAQALATLHSVCTLNLTNDSGSTKSVAAIIALALNSTPVLP